MAAPEADALADAMATAHKPTAKQTWVDDKATRVWTAKEAGGLAV